MASKWWGNNSKQLLADCEAKLNAALTENKKLRAENERFRKMARPPMLMVGSDDDAGEFGYRMSDGGW